MELLILQRLAAELDAKLRGTRIDRVYALPKNDVVLVCQRRSAPRLWFSAEPDHPHLYERPGPHPTPKRPPGFAMAARRLLNGRRLAAIDAVPGERIVELRTSGDDALRIVFEIIPRRATALIVDHTDQVRAVWQPRRGRPDVGERYVTPTPDTRLAIGAVDTETWDTLRASLDDAAMVRALVRTIAGMSPLMAREIVARHRAGAALAEAAHTEVDRAASAPTTPRIYSPTALDELATRSDGLSTRNFLLAPFPMRHLENSAETLEVTEFKTLIEAAAAFYPLRAALKALELARRGLSSAIDSQTARLFRTLDAVSDDAANSGDATQHRRWADLLLACPNAERTATIARVPDVFTNGDLLDIPVDPTLSLIDCAQLYYRRARRAERSAARTAARRRTLEARIGALSEISSEIGRTRTIGDCQRLGRSAEKQGATVNMRPWVDAEAPLSSHPTNTADDEPLSAEEVSIMSFQRQPTKEARDRRKIEAGIDVFTSSDGFEILVGRNADANERVTHRLSKPHDFWLHAEGPGSHVTIRNPQRAREPSDVALLEAASLAAYYSAAREATKVNVRWTQVRHLRKPRKGPKGQVIVRQANTVLATPISPEQLFADPTTD